MFCPIHYAGKYRRKICYSATSRKKLRDRAKHEKKSCFWVKPRPGLTMDGVLGQSKSKAAENNKNPAHLATLNICKINRI